MEIIVNGEHKEISSPCTVAELLTELNIGEGRLAVELNGAILPRSLFQQQELNPQDRIEIVQAIGGG